MFNYRRFCDKRSDCMEFVGYIQRAHGFAEHNRGDNPQPESVQGNAGISETARHEMKINLETTRESPHLKGGGARKYDVIMMILHRFA